jgi:hypothetical protein
MQRVPHKFFFWSIFLGQTVGCAFQPKAWAVWPHPTLPPNLRWELPGRWVRFPFTVPSPVPTPPPTPPPFHLLDTSTLSDSVSLAPLDHSEATQDSTLFLNRYDIQRITKQVVVNRNIVPFSTVSEEDVEELKRKYLADPYTQSLEYESLLKYFHMIFPRGKARQVNDPYYLNPSQLVDFSYFDKDELPERLHSDDEQAISRAEKGLRSAIKFAEDASLRDQGWHKDLRYYFKLMLEELDENPDIEKIKLAVVIMSSVGQHCGPGNTQGLEVINRIFFSQEPLQFKSPKSIEERIAQRLDLLREEIFQETVSFAHDRQTTHTVNHYRNLVASKLQIRPGFQNDPHKSVAITPLSESEVIERFFNGKKGNPFSSFDEERRSHRGYTPQVISKAIATWINEHQEVIPEIKKFFVKNINNEEVQRWVAKNPSVILKSLQMECDDPLENEKTLSELPWEARVNSYIDANFFEFDGRYWMINSQGLRKLLIRLNVVNRIKNSKRVTS